jgi:hypothetical protein
MTKFSGSLPKGDLNGLTALSNQLLRNPKGTHIIVGVIDVKTITTDVDTADQTATVRFRRVEAIDPADADHAVRMMQRAAERRTGAAMLPIEMEDELRELMDALDFETGELFGTGDGEMANPDADPDTLAHGDEDSEPAVPAETPDVPAETPEPVTNPAGPEGSPDAPAPAPDPVTEPAETEVPKKKRGRPTKAEAAAKKAAAEAAAAAPPVDLAAVDVPRAPWDDEPAAGMYPEHEGE